MKRLSYPDESPQYRRARDALLVEEQALRRQIEAVAARRRALPPGGEVPEDYVFERIGAHGMPEKVAMSELFGHHRTLVLYSFMYGPERDDACPMCSSILDSLDGGARHVGQRAALYVVAASPIARLVAWARERRWPHLRFVSTDGNRYSRDYYGETTRVPDAVLVERGFKAGEHRDETMSNVFRLDDAGKVRHFWGSELAWAPMEPGQDHRANDAFDTLWSVLDLTPEGRGTFRPRLAYQEERRSLRGFD